MYILRGWRQSDVGADGVGADGIGADESTYVSISQEDLVLMQVHTPRALKVLSHHVVRNYVMCGSRILFFTHEWILSDRCVLRHVVTKYTYTK